MILDQNNTAPVALDEAAENVFYAIAEEIGVLVTEDEAAAISKLEESGILTEQQNIVRLNKQAKLSSLTVRSALLIAQQRKDPLFAKYAKAADWKRKFRAAIIKKYGVQAQSTARKLLANAGRRNLVDISQKPSSFSHPDTKAA